MIIVSKNLSHLRLHWSLLFLFGPLLSRGDTVTLPVVADTFVNGNPAYTNNNAGGSLWFDVGRDNSGGIRRGLIRFDLSSLPAGVTVTSAVLSLTVAKVPTVGSMSSTSDLYRVTAAWNEGDKTGNQGSPATTGEATWNDRMFGVAGWTTPGALSDVIATPSASAAVDPVVGSQFSWSAAGMVNDIQAWLRNPGTNFGWLLASEAEATPKSVIGFASRESGLGTATLQLGYTPATGNSPPSVAITSPTNGASFSAPAIVSIAATAADPDGSVTNVEFFDRGVSLGSVATSPYRIDASPFPGAHVLTAVASDNLGATTTSLSVTCTINSVVITNPIASLIPKGIITVELRTVADGMASPVGMAVPDDGSGRMFICDQDGHVWVQTGTGRLTTPLLDVSGRLVQLGVYDERGLLGLAAHPGFAQHPLLYTYTSEPTNGVADFQTGVTNDHQSVIAEWRISTSDSNSVDMASRREILRIDEPQSNHNGGAMHFGPDGSLYIAVGDGGGANDVGPGHVPGGNAQDPGSILGKIIRIDIDGTNSANGRYGIPASNPFAGTNGLAEIYAYGLRNPSGFNFDLGTGNLWLADPGQGEVEEVDLITPGGNYGWNLREGGFWFDPSSGFDVGAPVRPAPPGLIDPVAQYGRDDGLAVIGGLVYRGTAVPALGGHYVFGDRGSFSGPAGRLFCLDTNNLISELRLGLEDRPMGLWLYGFGQGPDGELYVFGSRWPGPGGNTGRMLKMVPAPTPASFTGLAPVNGTNLSLSWGGGAGPFALQQKGALPDPLWQNACVTSATNFTGEQLGPSEFFRVADAAHVPRIPLTAWATGAAEHPANESSATAFGIFALDGNTMTFNIRYSGLSGPATLAHIHGPAPASGDAPPLIDLAPYNGGAWGAAGTVSGVIVLSDAWKALVLAGQTYINFHTTAFAAGEVRGQIAPVNLHTALKGANEIPAVNTPATGLGNLALVGNQLTFNITYQGLTGLASASHIHGPATAAQNAGVLTNLGTFNGGAYGASGGLSGTLLLTPSELGAVVDGLTYVNFHTAAHPVGEIRGQLVPQVTAVPLTVWLSGLAEKPVAQTNTAFGNGTLSLEDSTLAFNIVYGGLSGPAIGGQIRGPASSAVNGGVLVDLEPFSGGAFGNSGTLSGSVRLTAAQRDAVLNGQTYLQFLTSANPDGEMRGQIAPVVMTAGINGANENPSPVATSGTGSGTFALVRNQLSLTVTYGNLLSAAIASHIHGPAGFTENAGVLLELTPFNGGSYSSSGGLSGTASLDPDALLNVIDGRTYINFHTTNNPSGEMRGQLMR